MTGLVRDAWEIRRDGRLVWADALHLDERLAEILAHPAGFDGAQAAATTVYTDDAPDQVPDAARELLPGDTADLRSAATVGLCRPVRAVVLRRFARRGSRMFRLSSEATCW